ncbi:MAG: hypothetical protein ACREQV_09000 [Candidatus Binatia bacterium]
MYYPTPDELDPVQLSDGFYFAALAVVLGVLFCAVLIDFAGVNRSPPEEVTKYRILDSDYFNSFLLVIALGALAGMVVTTGPYLLSAEKHEMMAHLNRWNVVFQTAIPIGFVLSVVQRNKVSAVTYALLLAFSVFMGFRSPAAFAVIGGMFVWLRGRRGKSLASRLGWRVVVVVLLGALFLIYKEVYDHIKMGDFAAVLANLARSGTYLSSFLKSEPFFIQAILNRVLEEGFYTGPDHLRSIIFLVVPFANRFVEIVSFNDVFQEELFPGLDFGMAGNFWAQGFSVGGWLGLAAWLIIYLAGLLMFSVLVGRLSGGALAATVVGGAAWAFYIHRNDLLYQLVIERRVFALWMFVALALWMLRCVASSDALRGTLALRGKDVRKLITGRQSQ